MEKWQIQVITQKERSDIPQQKIKLEIARVPAHSRTVRALARNYEELPAGYANILLFVETLEEIAADKLFALAVAPYVRYRDIWDLRWISVQPAFSTENLGELVGRKLDDYRFAGDFSTVKDRLVDRLPALVASKDFLMLMRRFLPTQTIAETLEREMFREHLVNRIRELYGLVRL